MSFNYDCDYSLQAARLTPISKRQDVRLALEEAIASPVQWNHNNFFDGFLNGDNSAKYNGATAYSRYDRVNYQNKIYECTNDVTGELPTNTDYWVKVLNDFRGAKERVKYNCQKIMLEWILNKWFGTTFRQPNPDGLTSDFFIVDNPRDSTTFSVSETSFYNGVYVTSSTPELSNLATDFVGETSNFTPGANFTVHYPHGAVAGTSYPEYYQMVSLINKYKIFGSTVAYISY